MHPAIQSSRPLVFAHRGGSKIGPENTIAAFDRGLAAGADGLELDVHLSRDGIVVVHHDAAARSHHARARARSRTGRPQSLRSSTCRRLRDVLARYPAHGVIIELKEAGPALARAVVERGPASRRGRPRLSRIVQPLGAARRARCGARHDDERRAVRGADGAVSIVVRPVAWTRAATGRFRFQKPADHARRLAAIRRARAPSRDRRCRCGRSTSLRTFGGCSTGGWTALSRTGRMSPLRWSRTGSIAQSPVDSR